MDSLTVALGARSYPIHIGPGLIADSALYTTAAKQILIVSNEVVAPLYLERRARGAWASRRADRRAARRRAAQDARDVRVDRRPARRLALPPRLLPRRARRRRGRRHDRLRGRELPARRDFVQVPTTLLAQVDSSVGGKTGVNHPRGKNMIGAFHQPHAVLADTDDARDAAAARARGRPRRGDQVRRDRRRRLLRVARERTSTQLLRAATPAALAHAIRRSCEIKAAVVAEDERERGRRALLNFGHTFGHAIEADRGYGSWLHGEAVGARHGDGGATCRAPRLDRRGRVRARRDAGRERAGCRSRRRRSTRTATSTSCSSTRKRQAGRSSSSCSSALGARSPIAPTTARPRCCARARLDRGARQR